jgi:Cu/Ag efflux pump CusA
MLRVRERLKVVLPLTIFLIALLLYMNTKSGVKTAIVLLAVPFSLSVRSGSSSLSATTSRSRSGSG